MHAAATAVFTLATYSRKARERTTNQRLTPGCWGNVSSVVLLLFSTKMCMHVYIPKPHF